MSDEDLLELIAELEALLLEELAAKRRIEKEFELRRAVIISQQREIRRITRRQERDRSQREQGSQQHRGGEEARQIPVPSPVTATSAFVSEVKTTTIPAEPQIGDQVCILNAIKLAGYQMQLHTAVGEIVGETAKFKRIKVWNGKTNQYKIISCMPHNLAILMAYCNNNE